MSCAFLSGKEMLLWEWVSSGFSSVTQRRCSTVVGLSNVAHCLLLSSTFRETSLDFCSFGIVAVVLEVIKWLLEVLFRWTLSEMIFPKNGQVYRIHSVSENRCYSRWCSDWSCTRKKRADLEDKTVPPAQLCEEPNASPGWACYCFYLQNGLGNSP